MNGGKRHLAVNTIGLLPAVVIHATSVQGSDGARLVLAKMLGRFLRLRPILG